jgi:hypothetical protein
MARRAAAVLAVTFLAAVGCDSDPPPVIEVKKKEEAKADQFELKPPVKPAKSEPAAATLLKEALDAHTGGKPDRLDRYKSVAYTRTGVMETPGGNVQSSWTFDLVWPDRYRLRTKLELAKDGAAFTQLDTFALTPAGAWQARAEVQSGQQPAEKRQRMAMDAEFARTLKAQMSEDAVLFLFPLADPATVVSRGPDETLNGVAVVGLHVWTPALEYALVSFDTKTKLLARVVYSGREMATSVVKEVVVTDNQEFDGVKLPVKLTVKANRQNKGDWQKLTVTPGPIDPKVFDTP